MADELPTISIDDFMTLDDAKEGSYKQFSNEDYLEHLSLKEARNPAYVAEQLGVIPSTVERRFKKLVDQVLVRYEGSEPFYVLKPAPKKGKKAKKSKGVEI